MGAIVTGRSPSGDPKPPAGYLVYDYVLGMLAALAGGVSTAWIAPAAPLSHAVALSTVVLAMAVACAMGTGDKGPPRWYQAVLSLSSAVVVAGGGWLVSQA